MTGPGMTSHTAPMRGIGVRPIVTAGVLLSLLLFAVSAPTAGTGVDPTGKWMVTRTTDPILDTPAVVAVLPGTMDPILDDMPPLGALLLGSLASQKESAGPTLRLSCASGTLRSWISWSRIVSLRGLVSEASDLLVRFDENAPQWSRWDRFESTLVTEPGRFMERLGEHRMLALRVDPFGQSPVTVRFDLTKAKPIIAEVMSACRRAAAPMEALRQAHAEHKRIEAQKERAEAERRRIEAEKKRAEAERRRIEAARREEAERALEEQHDRQRFALLDAGRIEYIAQIKDKVERNWLRPPGTAPRLRCVVRVSQIPGGDVVQVEIRQSSGNTAFDRSVEEAVLRSSPLPVPKDPSLFDRTIVITFEPQI